MTWFTAFRENLLGWVVQTSLKLKRERTANVVLYDDSLHNLGPEALQHMPQGVKLTVFSSFDKAEAYLAPKHGNDVDYILSDLQGPDGDEDGLLLGLRAAIANVPMLIVTNADHHKNPVLRKMRAIVATPIGGQGIVLLIEAQYCKIDYLRYVPSLGRICRYGVVSASESSNGVAAYALFDKDDEALTTQIGEVPAAETLFVKDWGRALRLLMAARTDTPWKRTKRKVVLL